MGSLVIRPVIVLWSKDTISLPPYRVQPTHLGFESGDTTDDTTFDVHVLRRSVVDTASDAYPAEAMSDLEAQLPPSLSAISFFLGDGKWEAERHPPSFIESAIRSRLVVGFPGTLVLSISDKPNPPPWTFPGRPDDAPGSNWLGILEPVERRLSAGLPSLYRAPLASGQTRLTDRAHPARLDPLLESFVRQMWAVPHLTDKRAAIAPLERLLFMAAPWSKRAVVRRVYGDGRSGAAVALLEIDGEAPLIVKAGRPFAMQSELIGFASVMDRKLRTGIALNALLGMGRNGMVLVNADSPAGDKRFVALHAYSVAGRPGTRSVPRLLTELFAAAIDQPALRDVTLARLRETLATVIGTLHQGASAKKKTLWQSFGHVLPPLLELRVDEVKPSSHCKASTFYEGADKAWLTPDALRFGALHSQSEATVVKLTRYGLLDFEMKAGGDYSVQLLHPRLGAKVVLHLAPTLHAKKSPIAGWPQLPWLRRGAYIDAVGATCEPGQRLTASKYPKPENFSEYAPDAVHKLLLCDDPSFQARRIALLALTLPTAIGSTHGDLNLGNLLFSEGEPSGWLIDFEFASNSGAIAFDYAKLVVETLHHHLLPELLRICRASHFDGVEAQWCADNAKFLIRSIAQLVGDIENDEHAPGLVRQRALLHLRNGGKSLLAFDDPELLRSDERSLMASLNFLLRAVACVLTAGHQALRQVHRTAGGGPDDHAARDDMCRALAMYAFAATKFVNPAQPQDRMHVVTALHHFAEACLTIALPEALADPSDRCKAAAGEFDAERYLLDRLMCPPDPPLTAAPPAADPPALQAAAPQAQAQAQTQALGQRKRKRGQSGTRR